MNLNALFIPPDIAAGRQLADRLGKLHLDWAGAAAAKDAAACTRDTFIAEDLLGSATLAQLRAALLIATAPAAAAAPVPVVPGPLDVAAAVIGRDELVALAVAYGQACMAWGGDAQSAETYRACQRAWRELQAAVERLCHAAPAYELGGGRSS